MVAWGWAAGLVSFGGRTEWLALLTCADAAGCAGVVAVMNMPHNCVAGCVWRSFWRGGVLRAVNLA